jgi:hypothetical protein
LWRSSCRHDPNRAIVKILSSALRRIHQCHQGLTGEAAGSGTDIRVFLPNTMEFQMTKLPLIAFAVVAAAGLAAPAFAATSAVGNPNIVPSCPTGNSTHELSAQKDALATQLQLSTKAGSSIDMWGGCFQVTTHENGQTVIAYYDPDSLDLVARSVS